MGLVEIGLIAFGVWMTSLFAALTLGHWLELASDGAGHLQADRESRTARAHVNPAAGPSHSASRRRRWALQVASTRGTHRHRRCVGRA